MRAAGQDDAALARWQVLPDEDRAPCIYLDGKSSIASVSLSHSDGAALCALSPAGIAVGCDIEQIADRDAAFLETFFTIAERSAVNAAPDALRGLLTTLIWSAKESVLKLIRKGLSVDTWSVPVEPPALPLARDRWQPLRARYTPGREAFDGWWRHDGRMVWTLLSARGDGEPTSLDTNTNKGQPGCVARN
jgi:4'-phosphopantetheinyl transferase